MSGAWAGKFDALGPLRSSKRWQVIRDQMLHETPVCQICGIRAAEEVHHIKLAVLLVKEQGEEAFFDRANLACLCSRCHEKLHGSMRRGVDVGIFLGGTAQP